MSLKSYIGIGRYCEARVKHGDGARASFNEVEAGEPSPMLLGIRIPCGRESSVDRKELTVEEFADMLQAAVKGIQDTGERSFGRGAEEGDKNLVDAFVPRADSWSHSAADGDDFKIAFEKGAAAAVEGAEKTKEIVARMGRAGTVGERSLGHPDAGAYALGVIFTELSESLK